MTIGIYYIKNIINNKLYIGKSTNIEKEWVSSHRCRLRNNNHSNSYLQASWNKHGEENFEHKIILVCSKEELNSNEIKMIEEYKSSRKEYGYNLTNGGDGLSGWKMPEELKAKFSAMFSGKGNPFFGRKHTEQSKNAMSIYHRNNPISDESQKKAALNRIGKRKVFGITKNRGVKKKGNTDSCFVGVCFKVKNKKWAASICKASRVLHIGLHENELHGAISYDLAAIFYYSQDCNLNFPDSRQSYIDFLNKYEINDIKELRLVIKEYLKNINLNEGGN